MLKKLDPDVLEQTLSDGTIAMLLGGGRFLDALGKLSRENELAVIGSSANISLQGTVGRFQGVQRRATIRP